MSTKKNDLGFKIGRSITEEDIPPPGGYHKKHPSKYEPIITSAKTLEAGEGIEIELDKIGQINNIKQLLKQRVKFKHFDVTGRETEDGPRCYIVCKQ